MIGAAGSAAALLLTPGAAGPANALPDGPDGADGPAAPPRAARQAAVPLPPPPQVHGLDFMLGTYDCRQPTSPPGTVEVRMSTRRGLGGHYYYNSVTQFMPPPAPDVHALAAYGWDPVDGAFMQQYHDNWGSSGTATAPGWRDAHLRFTGSLLQVLNPGPSGVARGLKLRVKDDFAITGPGRFALGQAVTYPDGTVKHGALDCRHR